MSRIVAIGTATPRYSAKQGKILEYMHKAYADHTASRKLNALFHSSGIESRYSVLPDFSDNINGDGFFDGEKPDVSQRIHLFKESAVPLALMAIGNAVKVLNTDLKELNITHLITVTCTGIHSPGLDAILLKHLNLSEDTFHTSLNFLGCNAAFPSIKIADMISKTEANSRVLVVCVELCTLHFKPASDIDNLLSNTLFGDGAAAFIVVPDEIAHVKNYHGFQIKNFYSCLLDEGSNLMGWNISPLNFEMILNAGIPDFIGNKIKYLMNNASKKMQIQSEAIDRWAIHPGGRRILDEIAKVLNLGPDKMEYSYRVLRNYGNMSSPTVLFILNEILKDELTQGNSILSIGFGPGISVDVMLFTYA
jgi:predicted naringenin-chalcone synthase